MKRILASVLASLMLLPALAACSSGGQQGTDTTAPATSPAADTGTTVAEETTTDRAHTKDNLPADLNFNGETVRIACRGQELFTWELIADDNGDVVDSAIYTRNLNVEERLGVKLSVIEGDSDQGKYMDNIRATILATSPDYDIIAGAQYKAAQMVLQNCFRNLADEEYLDFEQPWWDSGYMENLTVDPQQIYMLAGDLTMTKIAWTAALYFNKSLYEDKFGDPNELYNTILKGEWTLDKLSQLCADVYEDRNGDGTKDTEDIMGLYFDHADQADRITFSLGIRFTERGEDGYPTLVFNNERTVGAVDAMYKLFYENPGVSYTEGGPDKFVDGKSLFKSGSLFTATTFGQYDLDYGILPWPKLNAEQDAYYSGVQDNIALYMLPITVDDARADMLCAVLEAMCSENYRIVTRAYYETALKFKYSDGELYSSVVDLIHNSATTDIAYVYSYSLNNIGTLIRNNIIKANNPNFSSLYKKFDKAVNASLATLINYYKAT